MTQIAIQTIALTKRYGEVRALEAIEALAAKELVDK